MPNVFYFGTPVPTVGGCILAAVIAYLLGSVSGAIVSSRVGHHEDIRNYGSGNAGMTNALRTYGIRHATIVAAMDMLKTVVAILIAKWLIGWHWGFIVGSCCAIAGHLFPIYYGFKGGKGVSCTCGAIFLTYTWQSIICYILTLTIIGTTKYVSLGSICLMLLYPVSLIGAIGLWNIAIVHAITCLKMRKPAWPFWLHAWLFPAC